jgi:hypothetical protein
MRTRRGLSSVLGGVLLLSPLVSNATVIYNDWTSVNGVGGSGNYIITVDKDVINGQFDINFTVNPWNAEGLGLFIDLGDFDIAGTGIDATAIAAVGLTNIIPAGEVTLFNTDTTSDGCGAGCNLNGFNPVVPAPDGEWELVFRLASQGYDGIQTFSFSIDDLGLEESDWGLIGVRAQQLCSGDDLLPGDNDSCGGSDKSAGTPDDPDDPDDPPSVPVPGTLLLTGLGLFGLGWPRKRRALA